MAWAYWTIENNMASYLHLHYHLPWVQPAPPVIQPHAAMALKRDKYASKTKVNNRKAGRTGTKGKCLIIPHLPLIGPHIGPFKDTCGRQTGWMGFGIGVHPFGGLMFVVCEGKPALGMLSNSLGCYGIAPGFQMCLPFVGLDFEVIPTHMPTVLLGPAPLALDLFVLLLSIISDVLDYLVEKINIPFIKDLAGILKDSVMDGLETAFTAYEQGVRPMTKCLAMGAKTTACVFVDGTVKYLAKKVTGPLGDIPIVGGEVKKWANKKLVGAANDKLNDVIPGYKDTVKANKERKAGGSPTPNKFFDTVDKLGTATAKTSQKMADKQVAAFKKDPPKGPLTKQQQYDIGKDIAKDAFKAEATKELDKQKKAVKKEVTGALGDGIAEGLAGDGKKPNPVQNFVGKQIAGQLIR